jgi:hypothetical protein
MKLQNMLTISNGQVQMLIKDNHKLIEVFGEEIFIEIVMAFDRFIYEADLFGLDSKINFQQPTFFKVFFIAFTSGWLNGASGSYKPLH